MLNRLYAWLAGVTNGVADQKLPLYACVSACLYVNQTAILELPAPPPLPTDISHARQMEGVQRMATKLIGGIEDFHYEE